MKKAIIIHGTCDKEEYFNEEYPSLSNSHWIPWLQKKLLIEGVEAHTPEIPRAFKPTYKDWDNALEKYDINKDTILVGHSCGGGFLLRWLSENKVKVSKLILVAPWLDPKREKTKDFFDFEIDSTIQERTEELHILVAKNDTSDIQASVKKIRKILPEADLHLFENEGHFTYNDMGSKKFPELLKIILNFYTSGA